MIKKLNVKKISSLFYFIGYLHYRSHWLIFPEAVIYERLLFRKRYLDGILVNQPNVLTVPDRPPSEM